ncbi:Jouberin [Desmophyllum pertusum]|uniref:Jouberin n=1 Tax=Desmophyllum pertusum TaxID=174260 RepID=A0A9W9ZX22_9CNID|nr:Jouberin [Desmophyllum pertusum]
MATDETSGSGKKKKHRRAKSNLESQGEIAGSTDQLISEESSRVLKARQRTQARFESFLQDAVAEDRCEFFLSTVFKKLEKKKKKKRTHTSDAVMIPLRKERKLNKAYKELLEGSSTEPARLDTEQADQKTPKKTRRKKTRTLTSEQGTPDESTEKPRRRKKPKTPEPGIDRESAKENLGYDNEQALDGEDAGQSSSATPKKKGGRVRRRLHDPEADASLTVVKKRADDGFILSVIVHRADNLKPDLCISHPMVRVHVVDMETGQYVKKSDSGRSVTSYYESESAAPVDYIMPVMTQPYDFKKYKSLMPSWEEVLLFNEIFSYFLNRQESDPKVVDFLSMTAAKRRKGPLTSDKGWYQVAWGFLKIVGGNGTPNTDKKVRLQLFQPPKSSFRSDNMVEEKGKVTFEEFALDAERRAHGMRDGKSDNEPTKLEQASWSGKRGCFILKFSHNGRYLACGCADLDSFPILIYEVPSYETRAYLPGHFSIIYDLCWAPDDLELLSTSSDGTVRYDQMIAIHFFKCQV